MDMKWNIWKPKDNLIEKYHIDSVIDSGSGLIIKLSNGISNKKLMVKWGGVVESHMYSKEGFNRELYNSSESEKWTFFKMDDSKYIKWIKEQSCGIYEDHKLKHFIIVGSNAVLDLIVRREPVVYDE
jgi:hypothetical protein